MGKKTAIQEFNRLINSKVIRLVFDTPEDWKRAKQIFDKYKYEDIGLTDSISFAIMERLELKNVFTFDKHFRQEGFECL